MARRKRVSFADLRGERFIVFRDGSASAEALNWRAQAAGFTPEIAFQVSDNVMLRALAAENFGVAVVLRWCFRTHDPPIAALELDQPALHLTLVLASADRFYRPPAAAAFLELARACLTA